MMMMMIKQDVKEVAVNSRKTNRGTKPVCSVEQ